jgi:predicted transcriptional regulator
MKNPETAKRINEAMEDLHISAKELSDRSEVSQASIS